MDRDGVSYHLPCWCKVMDARRGRPLRQADANHASDNPARAGIGARASAEHDTPSR